MTLRRKIIDFVGLGFLDDAVQASPVRHIAAMNDGLQVTFVKVHVQMVSAPVVE
jgi:hypothetical protein